MVKGASFGPGSREPSPEGLGPSGFDPSRGALIDMALALAPHVDANTAGELLRELCFVGGYGCYSTFDLVDGFEKVAPETLSLPVRTALAGCWAKDAQTIERMDSYVHRETGLGVAWYWDGDGTLVFKRGELFLYNSDCKKDHGWEALGRGDWVYAYRHYETNGGNFPCDSDGSPKGGDAEGGSVRSTTARAEGIAKP